MTEKIDSTSDDRTANNVVRHEYRILTDEEKAAIARIKDTGASMIRYFDEISSSRELSLAKTKVEEAVFWAVKHITA